MEVDWSGAENHELGHYPEPYECAMSAAKTRLARMGYGDSLLTLISNKTTHHFESNDDLSEDCMAGHAVFQVTLIPDHAAKTHHKSEEIHTSQQIPSEQEDIEATWELTSIPDEVPGFDVPFVSVQEAQAKDGTKSVSYDSQFEDASGF
ncbi:MAG: hypothetical protein SGARI_005198 [Bacillariaceae sp.]